MSEATINSILEITAKYLAQQSARNLMAWVELSAACRAGFWCVKCRSPFTDIGIAVVCNCPPPPFRSPFIYKEKS